MYIWPITIEDSKRNSAGYSLVVNGNSGSISVFDPSGTFIHSIGEFSNPFGVSVSPDGLV